MKFFNKFREISGKIRINFPKFPEIFLGKFPEISKLTTLLRTQQIVHNMPFTMLSKSTSLPLPLTQRWQQL